MTTKLEVYNLVNAFIPVSRLNKEYLEKPVSIGLIVDYITYHGNKPFATAAAKKALQQLRDNKLTFSKEGDIIIRD